jgi:uncharacterized protein (TIGR00369 family)
VKPRVPITDEAARLWASTDAVGFLRGWTTGDVDQGDHARHTGNVLVEVPRPGFVVMAWTPGPQLANLSGAVHGGYLALVCDEAAGLAAASTGERFIPMLTLDLDVTYLRPGVVDEEHRVEGEVLHKGRARIVSEARILRPDGKLAVSARGSFLPNAAFAAAYSRD